MQHRRAGQYEDIESRLIENRYRTLVPELGGYVSPEPLHRDTIARNYASGPMAYTYAAQRPQFYTDPNGLDWGSGMGDAMAEEYLSAAESDAVRRGYGIGAAIGFTGLAAFMALPAVGAAALGLLPTCGTPAGQNAQQVIADLAKRRPELFQVFNCKNCAAAMVEALKRAGIHGQHVTLSVKPPLNAAAGKILYNGQTISNNAKHYWVRVGNVIYDNVNPQGVPVAEFFSKLAGHAAFNPLNRVPF